VGSGFKGSKVLGSRLPGFGGQVSKKKVSGVGCQVSAENNRNIAELARSQARPRSRTRTRPRREIE
jgi:hypothetical protein